MKTALLLIGAALLFAASTAMAVPQEKAPICHVTLDAVYEVLDAHVIDVNENSIPAHLAHGDCPTIVDDEECVGYGVLFAICDFACLYRHDPDFCVDVCAWILCPDE